MATGKTKVQMKKLKQERNQTLLDLERLQEALKLQVDPEADEGDPDLAERDKVIALIQGLARKLEAIENALRQARNGTYGICEGCGIAINPARLEILPEATLCIQCKSSVERQLRTGLAAS